MSHFINKCSCGIVISQCRCFSKNRIETVVENGCSECKGKTASAHPLISKLRQVFSLADKLPGGKGDDKPDSKFDKKELDKGKNHEKEHTNDDDIAKEISKDHLTEDPEYYDKLEKVEAASKGPHHPCGKCFKWKKCECPEEEKEATSYIDAISLAMSEGHKEADCEEQEAMEDPDQIAKEIKKKHRNKPGT